MNAKYDCFSMHIKEEDRGTKTRHTCWSLEDRILILLLVTHPVPNSALSDPTPSKICKIFLVYCLIVVYSFSVLYYASHAPLPFEYFFCNYRPVKTRPTCAAQGCKNLKKYACSGNNLPVCSMECYNKVRFIPVQTAVV